MSSKVKLVGITLGAIIFSSACVIFAMNGVQNQAINLEEQIKTAKSDIQVQEKRRVDLVYNLVDTVKQYDKHEAETLKAVVEGRSKDGDIEDVNTLISAVTEAYPDLKSNENYKQLMTELSLTENLIAEYRGNYNVQVKEFNRYTKKFPSKQILSLFGYEPEEEYKYLDFNAPSDAPQNLFEDRNGNN